MNCRVKILYLFLVISFLLGCKKEKGEEYISLDTHVEKEAETKAGAGSSIVDATNIKSDGNAFTVYARRYTLGSEGENLFNNGESPKQVVNYTSGAWSYTPKAKWIRSKIHKFRAFYPAFRPSTGLSLEESDSSVDLINVKYRIDDSFDLLVGYVVRDPAIQGVEKVNIGFKHALSALQFSVKFKSPSDGSDMIKSCSLSGLHLAGNMLFGRYDGAEENDITWIIDGTFSNLKNYAWTNSGSDRSFNSTTPAYFYDNDNVVFVVPQPLPANSCHFHFTTQSGGDELTTVTLPGGDNVKWEAGKKYIYSIVISRSGKAEVSVEIKDWEYVPSNIDISI